MTRAIAFLACAALGCGQSFDVASVKPSPANPKPREIRGGPGSTDPGTVTLTSLDLLSLITMAYGIGPFQVVGPDWLNRTRFDLVAKVRAGTTVEQYRAMLQQLLAERFRLAVHRDQKEGRILELAVARNGPRLTASPPAPEAQDGTLRPLPGPPSPPPGYHGPLSLMLRYATMDQFTVQLSGMLGEPIRNATGLAGTYDIRLQYSVDLQTDAPFTSVFDAVQEQLGLKLTPGKGMIEQLVIDRIEKTPTGN
jgi:uncharacterized protein (TIGR03435 family)